jgi:hypothetical protein
MYVMCPTSFGDAGRDEVQYFEFFVQRLVPGFTRIADGCFWHQLLPQSSRSDPVIWNAVIAMACLIQHPQYTNYLVLPGSEKPTITDGNHRRALRWYGKSINALQKRISNDTTSSQFALIACILYICIECLQDNIVEALTLYQRAVGMLGLVRPDHVGSSTHPHNYIDDMIYSLLRHMAISQGFPVQWTKITQESAEGFQSLSDAREELCALIGEALAFIHLANSYKESQGKDWIAPSDMFLRRQHLESDFLKWHYALSNAPASTACVPFSDHDELRSVLLMAYGHYFIWLSTCLSNFETAFDNHFPMFQSMTEHAGRAIANTNLGFMFETRVIPSMFFVATKCRHPSIRRQAITILRNGPEVENTWKAEPMANVAEKVIGIEESGSEVGLFNKNPDRSELPPESDRVNGQVVVELKDALGRPEQYLKFSVWQQDMTFGWLRIDHLVKM